VEHANDGKQTRQGLVPVIALVQATGMPVCRVEFNAKRTQTAVSTEPSSHAHDGNLILVGYVLLAQWEFRMIQAEGLTDKRTKDEETERHQTNI